MQLRLIGEIALVQVALGSGTGLAVLHQALGALIVLYGLDRRVAVVAVAGAAIVTGAFERLLQLPSSPFPG